MIEKMNMNHASSLGLLLLGVTAVSGTARDANDILSSFSLSSTSWPFYWSGACAAFDEDDSNILWIIEGYTTSADVYTFNVIDQSLTLETTVSVSESLNCNGAASAFMKNGSIYTYTRYDSGIHRYDTITSTMYMNDITLPDSFSDACLMLSNDYSKMFWTCDADMDKTLYIYDFTSGSSSWTTGPSYNYIRRYTTCVMTENDYLWIMPGYPTATFEKINTNTLSSWEVVSTQLGDISGTVDYSVYPTWVYNPRAVVAKQFIFFFGGRIPTYLTGLSSDIITSDMIYIDTNNSDTMGVIDSDTSSVFAQQDALAITSHGDNGDIIWVFGYEINGGRYNIYYSNSLSDQDATTSMPTVIPSAIPSSSPSRIPSTIPSQNPSQIPSQNPSSTPTLVPTTSMSSTSSISTTATNIETSTAMSTARSTGSSSIDTTPGENDSSTTGMRIESTQVQTTIAIDLKNSSNDQPSTSLQIGTNTSSDAPFIYSKFSFLVMFFIINLQIFVMLLL